MDEFKKYLQDNHDKMDVDMPGEKLWQRISVTSAGKKKTPVRSILFRTAAAACIAVIAFLSIKNLFTTAPVKTTIPDAVKVKNNNTGNSSTAKIIIDTAINDAAAQNNIDTTKTTAIKTFDIKHQKKRLSQPEQLLASFENNYSKLVALQLGSIRNTPVYNETEDYFTDLKKQFRQAETDEADIKTAIKKTGLNDEMLQQLIAVYQQKINLLKTLQSQISLINKKVKENHNTADSLKKNFINI